MAKKLPPGSVPCSVEYYFTAWKVTFDDDTSLLLQTDYAQAAFAVDCGIVKRPRNWTGSPSALDWSKIDPTTIVSCPDCYHDRAVEEKENDDDE